jgi:hypothetical protein
VVQRAEVGRQLQRPASQVEPPQQSLDEVHTSSTLRHCPHELLMHELGGQHSVEVGPEQLPPPGTHIGRGAHTPAMHALGAQQSASAAHISPAGRHGGAQRRSRHVCGAQQSESVAHTAPEAGQGCQRRYETTTSSPMLGRNKSP